MYKFLTGTALAALATPAAAQTVVDTARTTPVATSTANQDLKIASAGSVTVASGNAVTVDSDNDLTVEGKIKITNANGANGVLVTGPRVADILVTSTGEITVDETYTPTDPDNDGDADGPFALGTNRAGIRVTGPLTGNLTMDGKITVEGNNSFGIVLEDTLTGKLTHNGTTVVTGDDSTAVRAGAISGDVRLAGSVSAAGENAIAAHFAGDIGGALVVQGSISSTGFRKVPAPSDPSKLDGDDLLTGGSAVLIEGDVAKGIYFAVAPKDTSTSDNDEDKDGLPDDKEGSAKVISYGSAPAVQIGDDVDAVAIGATVGTASQFGIINDGAISGEGTYAGFSGTGMQIAGRGGTVDVAGGLLNTGTIAAKAVSATATALRVGAGANVPEIRNTGSIGAATSGTAGTAIALDVSAGANLPVLRNGGLIQTTTTATGTGTAIRDGSGTLNLIENSGKISATGSTVTDGNVAIDLAGTTGNVIVRQTAVSSGATAPVIEGNVYLGAGNDLFDIKDGGVKGRSLLGAGVDTLKLSGDAVYFGTVIFGGQADILSLSGTSVFDGTADFGGGAGQITLVDTSGFTGRLAGSQNVAIAMTGGKLDLRGANSIASLSLSSTSLLYATLDDSAANQTAITVAGNASFAEGAKVVLRLEDLATAEGTYGILTAGSLTGADKLTTDDALVPFLYDADLSVAGNTLNVTIERKSTEDLGLNTAEGGAFDALYEALLLNEDAAGIFLGIRNADLFRAYVQQTLPDFAGGTFEGLSLGLRSFDRHLLDPEGPFDQEGTIRPTLDFITYGGSKDAGESAAYNLDGLGFRGGVEYVTGVGALGVSASYMWNKHVTGFENTVTSGAYEGGLHWRGRFGPVQTFARGGYGKASFDGSRLLAGNNGTEAVRYEFARDWSGDFMTASGGVSIEGGSQFFFFRPSVTMDYIRLNEDGYVETSSEDSEELDLTVDARKSSEVGVNAGMAVGVDLFGMKSRDNSWLRMELEGGWRELVSGEIGATTARFGDGDTFTLLPEDRGSGWFARLRGFGGDGYFTVGGELGAEERNGKIGYQLRASLRFGL